MTDDARATDADGGWVPLGPYNWATPLISMSGYAAIFGSILTFQLGSSVARSIFPDTDLLPRLGLSIATGMLTFLIAAVITFIVRRIRFPRPFVNLATSEIRVGQRVVSIAVIDRARLIIDGAGHKKWNSVVLVLTGGRLRLAFTLRNKRGRLGLEHTRVLLRVVGRSSIELPETKTDPHKRFARFNFPGYLSQQQTVDLLTDIPERGTELPLVGFTGAGTNVH